MTKAANIEIQRVRTNTDERRNVAGVRIVKGSCTLPAAPAKYPMSYTRLKNVRHGADEPRLPGGS